ncbi:hypothetical protein C1I98_33605 [Spongiactinospora gelatinilytica]|uniref:Uncharacterized protein n=1 Tax=Spongiactinospora gelatinilytica TaxID=2666298 RepID=A0A2W2FER0_9ACTN|nr:hypothetical protein [Spongiactinospora gelatinilytica]PZG27045.1 hypothetical protein C1I98_33605 [Spongiactinospora gelatinilytica]
MGDKRDRSGYPPVPGAGGDPGYEGFVEYDRRQERIGRHVVAAFALGLLFGVFGVVATNFLPRGVTAVFNPYGYFLLAVYVGGTATGIGWAALSSLLAALAPLVASMAGTLVFEGFDAQAWGGGSAIETNVLLVAIFGYGLAAYAARRHGIAGDLTAGLLGGVLLADAADKAAPGWVEYVPGFWPWPAAVVTMLVVATVALLRGTTAGRARALMSALVVPAAVILLAPPW